MLLVEADPQLAHAVVQDFGRGGAAVTVARTLAEAKSVLREGTPPVDVVVLELRLPDGRGESLLPDIEACPRQPAVIITSALVSELQAAALEYRPVAIAKPLGTAALLRMVRTVATGHTEPTINRFAERFKLSKRETEAILLTARGLRAKQVARFMGCAEPTVYGHLARICEKTGCSDCHEVLARLLAFACQALGHTPPDHEALIGDARRSDPNAGTAKSRIGLGIGRTTRRKGHFVSARRPLLCCISTHKFYGFSISPGSLRLPEDCGCSQTSKEKGEGGAALVPGHHTADKPPRKETRACITSSGPPQWRGGAS